MIDSRQEWKQRREFSQQTPRSVSETRRRIERTPANHGHVKWARGDMQKRELGVRFFESHVIGAYATLWPGTIDSDPKATC